MVIEATARRREYGNDDVTSELISFLLQPLESHRLREAIRRAKAMGARSESAALMSIVEGFHAAARRDR